MPFYTPVSPPIMWFPGRIHTPMNYSWSSNNFSNAWEVMGDMSLKTMLLIHFFFFLLKWQKGMNCSYCCHSLIFFWRVSFHWFPFMSCLHVLSQTSFRYISLLISLSFIICRSISHAWCLDMDPFPQGGFYWIKGNSCQVTSAIWENGERRTITHACISFASVHFESVMLPNIIDGHFGSSAP